MEGGGAGERKKEVVCDVAFQPTMVKTPNAPSQFIALFWRFSFLPSSACQSFCHLLFFNPSLLQNPHRGPLPHSFQHYLIPKSS